MLKKLFVKRPIAAYMALGLVALSMATLVLYLLYTTYSEVYIAISVNGWVVAFLIGAILINGLLFVKPNEYIAMAALVLPALAFGLFIIDPLIFGSLADRAMSIAILGNANLVPHILAIIILLGLCMLAAIACAIFCRAAKPRRGI